MDTKTLRGSAAHAARRARLYAAGVRDLRRTVRRQYGTSWVAAQRHAVMLRRRYGFAMDEALALGLLDPQARHDTPIMLSKREAMAIQRRLNPIALEPLTEDKAQFAAWCAHTGTPAPVTLAVLRREEAAGGSPDVPAATPRYRWAETLASMHGDIVVKPTIGWHGIGVRAFTPTLMGLREVGGDDMDVETVARQLDEAPHAGYVVQERLRNHAALDGLGTPEALHTLRAVTLADDDGARVLFTRMRIARTGVTANFGDGESGCMAVDVDPGTGRMHHASTAAPGGVGLRTLVAHPTRDVPWTAWTLPDWDEAMDMVVRSAEAMRPLGTLGWDVVFTPDGPKILETNMWWDPPGDYPSRRALADVMQAHGDRRPHPAGVEGVLQAG